MLTARLLRSTACLLVLALATGCATTGDPRVRQARGKFQTRRTYTQGIVGGAVVGALLGGAVGALLAARQRGNVGQGALRGALMGTGTGAVTGGLYASHVVRQRQAALAQEQALDTAIRNAASTRMAAASFNQTLESRLHQARRDSSRRAGTLADCNTVLRSLNREIAHQQGVLNSASQSRLSASSRSALRSELGGLESERHQLESNIDLLREPAAPPAVASGR
jgi:uncharacterized protein YcfJ